MQPSWDPTRRFRVGLLVLVATVMFLGLLVFIVGMSFGDRTHTHVLMFEENVKGLVKGSKVNFQGVPVGSVADIRFENGMTAVQIEVDPDRAEIQEVTRGRLDRAMVTGQVTVELEGYDVDARPLPDGALVKTTSSPIVELTQTLPDAVHEVRALLTDSRAAIADVRVLLAGGNRDHVAEILANLAATTRRLPGHTDAILDETRSAIAESREAIGSLRRATEAIHAVASHDDVAATLGASRRAAEDLRRLGARLDALVADLHGMTVTVRQPLLRAVAQASEALHEVGALARKLRVAPSSLIFGTQVPELSLPAAPPAEASR